MSETEVKFRTYQSLRYPILWLSIGAISFTESDWLLIKLVKLVTLVFYNVVLNIKVTIPYLLIEVIVNPTGISQK